MTYVTLAVTDLDRLTHALLLAKCDYMSHLITRVSDRERWEETKRNVDALNELYNQLEQVLVNEVQEG